MTNEKQSEDERRFEELVDAALSHKPKKRILFVLDDEPVEPEGTQQEKYREDDKEDK